MQSEEGEDAALAGEMPWNVMPKTSRNGSRFGVYGSRQGRMVGHDRTIVNTMLWKMRRYRHTFP